MDHFSIKLANLEHTKHINPYYIPPRVDKIALATKSRVLVRLRTAATTASGKQQSEKWYMIKDSHKTAGIGLNSRNIRHAEKGYTFCFLRDFRNFGIPSIWKVYFGAALVTRLEEFAGLGVW